MQHETVNTPPPCDLAGCTGRLFVRRIGIETFGCDGPEPHTDSQIRNAWVRANERESAEDRADMTEMLRRIDPVAWLLDQVDRAKVDQDIKITDEDLADFEELPAYASGLVGREVAGLIGLRGMTTLSGDPSSGKTWFALGAALSSALDGWDVHYIAAEAEDVIKRRVHHVFKGNPPERFSLHSIEPNLTTDDILERIGNWITSTRTLLVIDSISTLLAFMKRGKGQDQWEAQSRLETFLMGLRKFTRGEISIINISESNARGETKGRTLNYRSDMAINFKPLEDSDAREVRVMKAWESKTGLLGRARVDPDGPGLQMLYSGPNAYGDADEVQGESW